MKTLRNTVLILALLVPGVFHPTRSVGSEAFKPSWTSQPEVEKRAEAILKKMTLEEKIDYIGGFNGFYVRAVPRFGLAALKRPDGAKRRRNLPTSPPLA